MNAERRRGDNPEQKTPPLKLGLSVEQIALLQEAAKTGAIPDNKWETIRRIKVATAHTLNGTSLGMQLVDFGGVNVSPDVRLRRSYFAAVRLLVLPHLYALVYPGRTRAFDRALPPDERVPVHTRLHLLRSTSYNVCDGVRLNPSDREIIGQAVQLWTRLGIKYL